MGIDTPPSNELNLEQLNERFFPAIELLTALQIEFREGIRIDNQGQIRGISSLIKNHPILVEKQKTAMQGYESNKTAYEGSKDVKIINGAIIYTFDSGERIPSVHATTGRGAKKIGEIDGVTYSIIGIDINNERRKEEGVPADTTLHHEYQHHLNVTVGDALLFHATGQQYKSLERGSDRFMGIGKPARSRSELTESDSNLVSLLMGRPVALTSHPARKSPDYIAYENQMHYFDELAASYAQFKTESIFPSSSFYNNLPHSFGSIGNHYELIEGTQKDRYELRELFRNYLMPVIALKYKKDELGKIIQATKGNASRIITGEITKEEKERERVLKVIAQVVQILGVSRTVHQALALMKYYWKNEILSGRGGISETNLQVMHVWARDHLYKNL